MVYAGSNHKEIQMHSLTLSRSVLLTALLLPACVLPRPASAQVATYTFSSATFADGGTVLGSFNYDATANTVGDYNFSTTPGTNGDGTSDYLFTPTTSHITAISSTGVSFNRSDDFLFFNFVSPLLDTKQPIALTYSQEYSAANGIRYITGGAVTSGPVQAAPSALTYIFSGTASGVFYQNNIATSFANLPFAYSLTANLAGLAPSPASVTGTSVLTLGSFGTFSGDNPATLTGHPSSQSLNVSQIGFNFDTASPDFAQYHLDSPLGLVTNTNAALNYDYFISTQTTGAVVGFTALTVTGFSAQAVPEASTTVSFGLLLALGTGAFAVARKKKAA